MQIRLDRHGEQQWVWSSDDTFYVVANKLIYLFDAEYLWRPDGLYDIDYSRGLWAQHVRSLGFPVPEPDEEPFGRLVTRIDALIDEADHQPA